MKTRVDFDGRTYFVSPAAKLPRNLLQPNRAHQLANRQSSVKIDINNGEKVLANEKRKTK